MIVCLDPPRRLHRSTPPSPKLRIKAEKQQKYKESKRSVSFDHVYVHEHGVILGDNPAVMSGLPLTLDWQSHCTSILPIDQHEGRQHQQRSRASARRYTPKERFEIVGQQPVSKEEIDQVVEELIRIKKSRRNARLDDPDDDETHDEEEVLCVLERALGMERTDARFHAMAMKARPILKGIRQNKKQRRAFPTTRAPQPPKGHILTKLVTQKVEI